MKFPYGLSDFEKLITQGYVYIDRTDRIPQLEDAGDTLLFLRPRRFGKSLLLSMLENYYDVAKADHFDTLFGHLKIGQQPTGKQNQYMILKWNLSLVNPQGDIQEIKQALHDHLNNGIESFASRYEERLSQPIKINTHNAISSFESLLIATRKTPYPIYLLIDEYDNFANEVLMAGQSGSWERYEALIEGEGMLKTVFKAIKAGTDGQGIDHVFITGVSPVVMSDMTSGFNIATNCYLDPDFQDLCGFWEFEVAQMLDQIASDRQWSSEQTTEALTMMRTFYNGSAFTYSPEGLLYNPTLALYFLREVARHGTYPRNLLDSNLAMDRGKIVYISHLPNGKEVVAQAVNDEGPLSIQELSDRFGVKEILYSAKDARFMVSLLYYFGVLTLTDQRTKHGDLILRIPNLVIRKLYVERIQEMLLPEIGVREEGRRAAQALYQRRDIQPICEFLEQTYLTVFDNRDYRWTNELTIKTLFLTLLFNDTFYIMDSETAIQRDYADLTMIVRPDMRQFELLDVLIEFKYVSLPDAGSSGDELRQMSREEVTAIPAVKTTLHDARTKLEDYRKTLQSVYDNTLRLHVFCVVAVGYDRLVWEELKPDCVSASSDK